MERGTDWEREAVERQWAALEHEHSLGTRLLEGVMLVLLGIVALLLANVSAACFAGDGFIGSECVTVIPSPVALGLAVGGLLALGVGLWRCWQVARD